MKCSVQNGSDLIDLTPLITGYYTAMDEALEQSDKAPDFYINICQPLNPIAGVRCPPGAAVCMDPNDGPPVVNHNLFCWSPSSSLFSDFNPTLTLFQDIGRITRGPEINKATGKVFISYTSSTQCSVDPSQNYTSTIVFTCKRGLEKVGPPITPPLLY